MASSPLHSPTSSFSSSKHIPSFIILTILLLIIPPAYTQCGDQDNCTAGTFCYTQDNTNMNTDDDSPTTYCAPCMVNCTNCTDFNNCNSCKPGSVLYTQTNQQQNFIDYTPTTISCTSCPTNCVSCSTPSTCDQCAQGYSGNGSYCGINDLDITTVGTNSYPNSKFNMVLVFAIIGGVIGIGVIAVLSFYCVTKRRKALNFPVQQQYSAKEEMMANEMTYPTPKAVENDGK